MARNLWNLYALFLRGRNTTNSPIHSFPRSVVSPQRESPVGVSDHSTKRAEIRTLKNSSCYLSERSSSNFTVSYNSQQLLKSKSSDSYFASSKRGLGHRDIRHSLTSSWDGRTTQQNSGNSNDQGGHKNNRNKRTESVSDKVLPIGMLLFAGGAALHNLKNQQNELDEVEAKLWNQPSRSAVCL